MNFKESKAIYLQIADRICDEVLLGQYRDYFCKQMYTLGISAEDMSAMYREFSKKQK